MSRWKRGIKMIGNYMQLRNPVEIFLSGVVKWHAEKTDIFKQNARTFLYLSWVRQASGERRWISSLEWILVCTLLWSCCSAKSAWAITHCCHPRGKQWRPLEFLPKTLYEPLSCHARWLKGTNYCLNNQTPSQWRRFTSTLIPFVPLKVKSQKA